MAMGRWRMVMKSRLTILAAPPAVCLLVALWAMSVPGAPQALRECLRATTVEMMPLPEGCAPTDETPPASLMRVVEQQRDFYHLTLQRLILCRTPRRFPQSEPSFAETAFDAATRRRWLPLYVGCCSYQFRRHVAVVVADVNESGSMVVEAALVQSSWDYLRLNWARDRSPWF